MLGVEGVVGSSTTTVTTFPTPTMATTVTAPTVVAGTGVGLLPLVTVPAASGEPDPRSLLVPSVPTLSGSNPAGNNTGSTATSQANTNNNNNNSNMNNPAAMEQAEEFVKPIMKDGEILLEVECGQNKAFMYLSRLCQGSKGPCISFKESWLTPNEFQFVSGRETAKDWKRSIRHHGKSLKLLLAKGILTVHPTMCDCEGCRIGAVLTRKGEKRRIPNGERKRKSTGNAPENSGNGAFRAVGNMTAVKTSDGPPEPKRPALDKSAEGSQSPLKESSMLNLPPEAKDGVVRQPEIHVQDVSKLDTAPLMPLMSSDRDSNVGNGLAAVPPAVNASKAHKDSGTAAKARPQQSSLNGQSSGSVSPSADVKVLSSSGRSSAIGPLDKSLSRLALYHAASASMKTLAAAGVKSDPTLAVSTQKADNPVTNQISSPGEDTSGSSSNDSLGNAMKDASSADTRSPPPQQESGELPVNDDTKDETDVSASEGNNSTDVKDLKSEDSSPTVITHSIVSHAKLCEPNNNSSITISVSTPMSLAPSVAAITSPVIASAAPAASDGMPHLTESTAKDFSGDSNPKHTETSSTSSSTSLSPPHNQHLEKEGHITIRHPSPERHPQETASPAKHSPIKPSKEHSSEKHKDRKHESTSTSFEQKDRHSSKDSKETLSSRQSHERDQDRRRQEERPDKERKSGSTSGQSSRPEEASTRGPELAVGGGSARVEGIVTCTSAVPPAVPVPPHVADPAAFSEYMRVLAAGHNGFVSPSMGCLPGMFPLRPPTDVPLNSAALMHPMQAAACSMFSSPAALMPKDPVMYPATPGTLHAVTYGYGAPGMTPLPLIPQQYSTAAPASMLDYSRPFPYLSWSPGLPLVVPDAMNAAAVAAAAAESSAKRSREEMESAMDKRLPLPVPPYGVASVTPMDYFSAYRGLPTPLSCGLESSMYDKNAELLRKRMYPELMAGVGSGSKGMDSPYLASLPEYYRALYCCRCMENQPGDIRTWPVEEVVKLVSSLEGCSAYTEIFREQRVDGKILVLLTTDHLMKNLGMKIGPAMTLTSRVAKLLLDSTRSSGCGMCRRLASMVPVVQSAVGYS